MLFPTGECLTELPSPAVTLKLLGQGRKGRVERWRLLARLDSVPCKEGEFPAVVDVLIGMTGGGDSTRKTGLCIVRMMWGLNEGPIDNECKYGS